MKNFPFFLLVFLLTGFGTHALRASPVYQQTGSNTPKNVSRTQEAQEQRLLRRRHTREAYMQNDATPTSFSTDNPRRSYQRKKMTPDERMRLRQQIDEAGQAIYH